MSTRFRTATRQPADDPDQPPARDARAAWYRQSIVWVGAAVLGVSIAGCVWLIVVAERYADPPLPDAGMQILKMPLTRPAAPPRTAEPQS